MRDFIHIAVFGILVAAIALFTQSGVMLNFVMLVLYAGLLSTSWNLLGGFAGQLSFGHALFFGMGAYTQSILQMSAGFNPWLALPLAILAGVAVALMVGGLTFRYGIRGSYFALVTLAFAEVFRILALSVPITGAGVGLMLPLRASVSNMQFASQQGYVLLILAFVLVALCVTAWLRHSRLGAYMQAVRDNEAAARAIGVNPVRVKLAAIALSATFMSAGGAFYVQVFHYIDPGIAFGSAISVEALVGAIVGGAGTLWGPMLGALALHTLSDLTRNLFGELPGINLVVYGAVLVLIVMFLPRGVAGSGVSVRDWFRRKEGNRG